MNAAMKHQPRHPSRSPRRSPVRRPLQRNANSLQDEVARGETVSATRGKRNHQLVNQAGNHKHHEARGSRPNMPAKRKKHKFVGELAEAQIPAFSPELAQRAGQHGSRHDRRGRHSPGLPEQRIELETAKVQQENETKHSYPTLDQIPRRGNVTSHPPDEHDAQPGFQRSLNPLVRVRFGWRVARVQKRFGVHSGPGKQIRHRAPRWMRNRRLRPYPCGPLQPEENRCREQPHENPCRHAGPRKNHCRGDEKKWGPRNPRRWFSSVSLGTFAQARSRVQWHFALLRSLIYSRRLEGTIVLLGFSASVVGGAADSS